MTSRRHRKIRQLIFPLWRPRTNRHPDPFWLLLIPSIPKTWKMWGSFGSGARSRDIVSYWTAECARFRLARPKGRGALRQGH
jgi:hypothetical protein